VLETEFPEFQSNLMVGNSCRLHKSPATNSVDSACTGWNVRIEEKVRPVREDHSETAVGSRVLLDSMALAWASRTIGLVQ